MSPKRSEMKLTVSLWAARKRCDEGIELYRKQSETSLRKSKSPYLLITPKFCEKTHSAKGKAREEMKVVIIPNKTREGTKEAQKRAEGVLKETKTEYEELKLSEEGDYEKAEGKESELALYIGGDGTMLRAAKAALKMKAALSGINTGNVGYLVGMEAEGFEEELRRLVEEGFETEECVVLEAEAEGEKKLCVNEAAIYSEELKEYRVKKNGEVIFESRASGIVITTAVGSTGLNRSAGGAVLEKELRAFEITPLCAYSKERGSLVVSSEWEYEVEFEGEAKLKCDGESSQTVAERVKIRKNEELLRFARAKRQQERSGVE